MTVTLQALFDANADTIRAAADAWNAVAEDLDNATEDLIRGTQDLDHQWPDGPAAEAAHAKTRETRNEASNAVAPCRTIGRALREWADTVRSLQHTMQDITAEANKAGFQVDVDDGTVAAPAHMYQTAGSGAHIVAQQCSAYMWQLDGVLSQAIDVDRRTTATVNANLPDPQKGFGSLAAPTVTAAQLQAMKGTSPDEVNQWWNSLTAEQQDQVLRDHPLPAGNLDGVPADDRNTANRSWLGRQRQALQAEWDSIQHQLRVLDPLSDEAMGLRNRLWDLDHDRKNLDDIQNGLDRAGARGMLLGVDPAGDGKAIIAIGNPDTAAHTAVWVPGLSTNAGSTSDNVDRMLALNDAAKTHTKPGEDVCTIYWLGYDAPETTNLSVAFEDRSKAGEGPYLNFMESMRATHHGADNHLTAMGHSYGSTVVGEAALTGRLPVDDLVTQGSPGTHATHAGQLMHDTRHVWAGASDTDPVSGTRGVHRGLQTGGGILGAVTGGPLGGWVGSQVGDWVGEKYDEGHRTSPHYADFGANKYHVDTDGHTSYWDRGSTSLDNQGAIIAGDYEAVGMDHGQKPENWK